MVTVRRKLTHPDLQTVILASLSGVVVPLLLLQAAIGYYLIDQYVIRNAQQRVDAYINSAHIQLTNQVELIGKVLSVVDNLERIDLIKEKLGLDYLFVVDVANKRFGAAELLTGEIVARALNGVSNGGLRIMSEQELALLGQGLTNKAFIKLNVRDGGGKAELQQIRDAMVLEYAVPFFNAHGAVTRVVCGGIIINNRVALIDAIHRLVFEDRLYGGKPIGTVTVFKDNVRIATNVLDKNGRRAIGTLVSPAVYEQVMVNGKSWFDRALVVNDWYLTAYEPLDDVQGRRIGMLYVGILEKPFTDLKRGISFVYMAIMLVVIALAIVFSIFVANKILRPVSNLLHATERFSSGDLEYRIELKKSVRELDILAEEFNNMAQKLRDRELALRDTNEKLVELNKSYLDLVNIVSHDIKGVLSSAVMNICSIKDGILGPINEDQARAVTSIARTLDYLTSTVRRILDLGRIEKGELVLHSAMINFNEDVIKQSLEAFERQIQQKSMHVENNLPQHLPVYGDPELLLIAVNNLIGNAITYGTEGGNIIISSQTIHTGNNASIEIEIYNDGTPITREQMEKLFHKFSRLEHEQGKRYQGTGLGLYITKEILSRHGAGIRAESREHGNTFIISLGGANDTVKTISS